MGFGLLFLGYFTATLMSINTFGAVFKLAGYVIMLVAALKLKKYNRSFLYFELAACVMLVLSTVSAAVELWTFIYDEMLVSVNLFDGFDTVLGYAEMLTAFAFNSVLLYSIRSIAVETGTEKITVSAVRNFIFMSVYYVLYFIGVLPFDFVSEYLKYCGAFILVLNFVWIILNLVLIYSCYARICDENDIDMPRKPSRFAFVNKLRAESEARQAQAAAQREEYRKQKSAKRRERKK